MMISETAEKAIEAYGGVELWKKFKYIEAIVSVKGLAFTLKQRPFFDFATIVMEINRPFVKITPIGKNYDISGVLDGHRVRLEDSTGKAISERANPRSFFPYGRRLFYWDDLDMAYFANYAFWNYFTLPNLLMNSSIKWIEKENGFLQAIFPDTIPTHCKNQEFHFDKNTGLMIQHNYTVDIISKYATAAHVIHQHKTEDGVLFPFSRVVTPMMKNGIAMKSPVLIDIVVHNFKLTDTLSDHSIYSPNYKSDL